jgi:hypothetical protein
MKLAISIDNGETCELLGLLFGWYESDLEAIQIGMCCILHHAPPDRYEEGFLDNVIPCQFCVVLIG